MSESLGPHTGICTPDRHNHFFHQFTCIHHKTSRIFGRITIEPMYETKAFIGCVNSELRVNSMCQPQPQSQLWHTGDRPATDAKGKNPSRHHGGSHCGYRSATSSTAWIGNLPTLRLTRLLVHHKYAQHQAWVTVRFSTLQAGRGQGAGQGMRLVCRCAGRQRNSLRRKHIPETGQIQNPGSGAFSR